MEKLNITLWSPNEQPIEFCFKGEWLVAPWEEHCAQPLDYGPFKRWNSDAYWAVAKTSKGKFAVYMFGPGGSCKPYLDLYDSFEAMEGDVPPSVMAAVAAALDNEYEVELDI
jgi:hypothetical protein